MTEYASENASNPRIYHTNKDCPNLPDEFEEIDISDRRTQLRECSRCEYSDIPEL